MRHWFLSNYENPAERTPHECTEGGYIYIWAGPYNARDELSTEFGKYVSEEVINEVVEELESESIEWISASREDDYDA